MTRTLILLLVALVAVGGFHIASPREAQAHVGWKGWRWDDCRFQSLERGHWTREEVKRTIRCAVRHWPVPGGVRKAISVARCESGLRHDAYGGGNAGVFQQRLRYWEGRWRQWGKVHGKRVPSSPFNARTNVIVSIRMVNATGTWSAWSCA